MKVHRGWPKQPGPGRALTLGVFDGVHRGHVRLLRRLRQRAQVLGVRAGVVTFDDHPHGTLAPSQRPPRLATPQQCLERFRCLGMDEVFLIRFDKGLAGTPAEAFVRRVLVRRLGVRHVVVGQDFVFGRGGRGGTALLRQLGRSLGFGVTVVPPLRRRGRVVSSSGLREQVAQGRMREAWQWLGWPYTLHGRVVRGEGRGRTLGLPTANLRSLHELVPPPGIYLTGLRLAGRLRMGLCYIGRRPTFHPWGPQTIEINIPGWSRSLYGRRLAIHFYHRLRGDRRFSDAAALLRQVAKDRRRARHFWTKWSKVIKM
ncbi:MAG: riboflavin biosynthesis protein RibF [candidate division FCPU426 bacterium]